MIYRKADTLNDKLIQLKLIENEANTVRERDKSVIASLLHNFYGKKLEVGIGFNRAYGSILSGDFYELIKLPDGNYLFIFADISGHGLPAYTTVVRLRAAVAIAIKEQERKLSKSNSTVIDSNELTHDIVNKFTDIIEFNNVDDFACVLFTYIYNYDDKFFLKFYNRSMLFPMIVRKYQDTPLDIYDLNMQEKGWIPKRGHLLGFMLRELVGDEYYENPLCEFQIYEGDRVLFFSDGITEATNKMNVRDAFEHERLKKILTDNVHLSPKETINLLFNSVYDFIGDRRNQVDDMTAIIVDFPLVR